MKKNLRNIITLVVTAAIMVCTPTNAFAIGRDSRHNFSFWKPWKYFFSNNSKDDKKSDNKNEETISEVQDNFNEGIVEVSANEFDGDSTNIARRRSRLANDELVITETSVTHDEIVKSDTSVTHDEIVKSDTSVTHDEIVKSDTSDLNVNASNVVDSKNNIYLYNSDEFGRVKRILDKEFIGEYKIDRKHNFNSNKNKNNNVKAGLFEEGLPIFVSSLKINDDYTGSFKIGLSEEKNFKIVRQGNSVYLQILSDKEDDFANRYRLRSKKVDDKYMLIFDGICWEKAGVYGITKENTRRGDFDEVWGGFRVDVPHIGCPTEGESNINAYYSKVLKDEYDELERIYNEVRRYFYANISYDMKYNKNNIVSVFREREINGGEGMRNRISSISYKSFAEVFDRAKGSRLDITDVLRGSKADVYRLILDCYRGTSSEKDSIRVSFASGEDDVECSDSDIINRVSFYVDDNDLVFVLDVFDGSRLEIGRAVYKINIKENENLFTQEFLTSYKG